jgi:hypothetical protein
MRERINLFNWKGGDFWQQPNLVFIANPEYGFIAGINQWRAGFLPLVSTFFAHNKVDYKPKAKAIPVFYTVRERYEKELAKKNRTLNRCERV